MYYIVKLGDGQLILTEDPEKIEKCPMVLMGTNNKNILDLVLYGKAVKPRKRSR